MENLVLTLSPVVQDISAFEDMKTPSMSYWQDAWRRLKQNKYALLSLGIIVGIILAAIIGPFFSAYSYSWQELDSINHSPSWDIGLAQMLWVEIFLSGCCMEPAFLLSIGVVVSLINLGHRGNIWWHVRTFGWQG